MEFVVRTAHGDAEVAVESSSRDVAIGELLETVLGAPAPAVVWIDGRAVPTATSLGSSGAVVGSIVEVDEPPAPGHDRAVAELVQIAGPGAGHRAPLSPGSYVLGPSRRVGARPLSDAPVDEAVVRLGVSGDGRVGIRLDPDRADRAGSGLPMEAPVHGDPAGVVRAPSRVPVATAADVPPDAVTTNATPTAWLDGVPLTDRTELWTTGSLTTGGRVYELRRPGREPVTSRRRFAGVTTRGTASYNRPLRPAPTPEPEPIVVPAGDARRADAPHVPLLPVLAPVAIAIGAALATRDAWWLLVALASPVVAGAWWVAGRRRARDLPDGVTSGSGADVAFRRLAAERHHAERRRRSKLDLDAIDVVEVATNAGAQLWARRPGDDDVFRCAVGLGDLPWFPELERSNTSLASADDIVAELGPLRSVPVEVDLGAERGVGVVGDDEFTEAMVRGLVLHACVTHGPADLDLVVLTTPGRRSVWEWAKWLPHVRTAGMPRILTDVDRVVGWASAVVRGWDRPSRPTALSHLTLVVIDDPTWWRALDAPLRPLFSDPTLPLRFVAVADAADGLPAVCTTIVAGEPGDAVTVEHLLEARAVHGVAPFLFTESLALDVARRLAPLDDPDLPVAVEGSLPSRVPIARLLELDRMEPEAIRARWAPGRRAAAPVVAVGIGERGPLDIDLVDDGPHGLVAGAAGSGKSELLRSLIAGLAANLQPDEVNFLVVDLGRTGTFDACRRLPHTVGSVAGLDEHGADRLLRCLRAELRHRESVVRSAGAASLHVYQRIDGLEPLPRLVIVVDEVASVAARLPELLGSLVDVAQRGRSLGIHLLLATDRPAGVLDRRVTASTNLRIALRVQDAGDSLEVIGSAEAATLSPRTPGRAYLRIGTGELTPFQAAYSTGSSSPDDQDPVEIRPWVLGRHLTPLENRLARRIAGADRARASRRDATDRRAGTDLDRLVEAIRSASDGLGQSGQRAPAPPLLPDSLPLDEFFASRHGDAVPVGLVDLPDEQRQAPLWWEPGPTASRLVHGVAGSGTSSFLVALALGIATRYSADDVHLFVIDADTSALAPLVALPHCGGVVRLDEVDRIGRLARELGIELDRRAALAAELGGPAAVAAREPSIVLMIDNLGALRQALGEHHASSDVWPELDRLIRGGQPLGICAAITVKEGRAVPGAVAACIPDALVMRLGDPSAYATFGLRPVDLPTFVPGRAVRPDDRAEIQLVEPPSRLAAHIDGLGLEPADARPPMRVDPLPPFVRIDDVVAASSADRTGVRAAVGLDPRTARPAVVGIPFGEALFVTGPGRSDREAVLRAIAAAAKRADPDIRVFGVSARGLALVDCDAVDDAPADPAAVAAWVDRVLAASGRSIVLVEDADRVAGPEYERLATLVHGPRALVVAGRADSLAGARHWTAPLRADHNAVLIRPSAADLALVDVWLGDPAPRFGPHMGLLIEDGDVRPFMAVTDEHAPDGRAR